MNRFALVVVGLLMTATVAQAGPVLDQSYTETPDQGVNVRSSTMGAQTFTVGISGWLSSVDVLVSDASADTDLTLEIRSVDSAGKPTSSTLTSKSLSASSVPDGSSAPTQWTSFDFSDIQVSSGEEYAIVLKATATTDPYIWWGTEKDGYSGGKAYIGSPFIAVSMLGDLNFKTYVVPLPAAAWIGFGLLGGLGLVRRLRRRTS